MAAALMKPMESDEFRQIRWQLDLTQVELALRLGVSTRAIKHWEAGTRGIDGPKAILMRLWRDAPRKAREAR